MTGAQMAIRFRHRIVDVDFALPAAGISVVYGRSGSGKTSLLRLIAGLDECADGFMQLGDEVWQDGLVFTPTFKRNVGYIFQEASLFDHLTVAGNLAFAQKRAREKALFSLERISELMGIGDLLGQYPPQLSGGEKQRIAIARALLFNPKILLMDEPLASLDAERKREILPLLEQVRDEFGIPIVYVTHSMNEVARLADHLVILEAGRVVAQGNLQQILPRLDLPILQGDEMGVVIEAKIAEIDAQWQLVRAEFIGGSVWLAAHDEPIGHGLRLRILARDVSLSNTPLADDSSIVNGLAAEIVEIAADAHPAMKILQLKVGENLVLARITNRSFAQLGLEIGGKVWANVKSVSVMH